MAAETLVFRPRTEPINLPSAFDARAVSLAHTIVRMASRGAEGNLHETLQEIGPDFARAGIEETVWLYLFIAQRTAGAFLQPDVVSEYQRDAFLARLREEIVALLTAGLAEDEARCSERERLGDDWDERRAAYAACQRMYRQENESLQGTVIWAYYRRVVALGRESALHLLANLEVPLLHVELSKTLAELICDTLGLEV